MRDSSGLIGIDLFAGAGGMSFGARQAGVKVELAMESDPHAAEAYAANHQTTQVFAEDIRTLTESRIIYCQSRQREDCFQKAVIKRGLRRIRRSALRARSSSSQ